MKGQDVFKIAKGLLMLCGATVVVLWTLSTVGIGEFAVYYGKPGFIHNCVGRD